MLRKLISLLVVLLVLVGCAKKVEETPKEEVQTKSFSILCPNGAPALSLLDFVGDDKYDLDFVDGADVLQAEFTKGEKDFIIAPINLGYKFSEKTSNYELKGVVTWGNLYVIGKDDSIKLDGKIACFGEAAVPGKIINYIVEKSGYTPNITWFPSVADAATAFLTGEFDYAIVAEPYLTNLGFQSGDFKVLGSVSELYKQVTGLESFPQAALFVKKSLVDSSDSIIDEVTNKIKETIDTYTSDQSKLDNKLGSTDISIMGFNNKKIILDAYNSLGLKYVDSNDCKQEITYLLKLFDIEYK